MLRPAQRRNRPRTDQGLLAGAFRRLFGTVFHKAADVEGKTRDLRVRVMRV